MLAKYLIPALILSIILFWVLAIIIPIPAALFLLLRNICFGILLLYGGILLGIVIQLFIEYKGIEYSRLKKEHFELTLADGITIHGEILSATDDDRSPVILACHGWTGKIDQLYSFAYPLAVQGYKVVCYNHRGHGLKPYKSGGNKSEIDKTLTLDVRQVIDFIESRPDLNHERLGAIGFSLGGFTLLTGGYNDPRIKVSVVFCAGHDMFEINKLWPWYLRLYFRFTKFPVFPNAEFNQKVSPKYYLGKKVDKVICLVHAKNDLLVPYNQFLKNVELLNLPAEQTLSFETGNHGFFGQNTVALSQTIKWFNQYL
ncbi:MAG TPA: alpha/beta fold hydrolase [Candidatus Deferrimicrobium sp.]|nr:alpha/beta fold hydrolase [Candidatus Deferrimicrobium sp.]